MHTQFLFVIKRCGVSRSGASPVFAAGVLRTYRRLGEPSRYAVRGLPASGNKKWRVTACAVGPETFVASLPGRVGRERKPLATKAGVHAPRPSPQAIAPPSV